MKLGYIHRYHRYIAILSVTFCPTKKILTLKLTEIPEYS